VVLVTGNGHLDPIAAALAAIGCDVSGGQNACWPWTGRLHPTGYVRVCVNLLRTTGLRYSWQLMHDAVPRGRRVYHACGGGPRCMNPAHLSLRRPQRPPKLTPQQRRALKQYIHDVEGAQRARRRRPLAAVA
jgi:hypothetical protein